MIEDDEGSYEVVAESVSVRVGRVYHHDRGESSNPGERIADRVVRRPGEGA